MTQTVNRGVTAVREGVRGIIVLSLIGILACTLFFPTEAGSSEVQAGLLTLLGFTARDYFAFKSSEDATRVEAQANQASIGG